MKVEVNYQIRDLVKHNMNKFQKLYESTINKKSNYKKYLLKNNYVSKKITSADNDKDTYEITNLPDAQIYKGVLHVLNDGRAYIDVDYKSYSGIKNKHITYFDKNGNEIVGKTDKEEKETFDSL